MDSSLLASIRNFKKTKLSEAETVDKSVPEGVVPQTHIASSTSPAAAAAAVTRPSRSTIASRSHARVASSDSLFGGSSNGRSGSGSGSDEEDEDQEEDDVKPTFADLRKPTISRPAGNSSLFTDISDETTRELMIGFVEQLKSGKPLNVITMVMKSRLPDERLHERVLQAAGMSSSSSSTSIPTSPVSSAGSATSPKSKRKKEKRKKEKRNKNNASDEHEMTSTRRPPTSPGAQDRVSDIASILGTQRQIKKAEKKSHIAPPLIHTPIKQGWMNKQSRYLKQWRCRWFVLQGDTLYTFKSQHVLEKPTETISLKTYNLFQPITDISMPINAMELSAAEQPKLRTFTIDPLNEPTKHEWIRALEKAMKKAART